MTINGDQFPRAPRGRHHGQGVAAAAAVTVRGLKLTVWVPRRRAHTSTSRPVAATSELWGT